MLRLLAEERGVVLNVRLQDACTVRGAEDDLYQMVYNLTENAIKYNQPGGFVEITLRRTGETAQIEVADDGIGIPEEDLPKVFERFTGWTRLVPALRAERGWGCPSCTIPRPGGAAA